jgi:putative transposase
MVVKRRKNIRLSREIYEEPSRIFSVTICTAKRQRLFENPELATKMIETLYTGPMGQQGNVFAYCLMPDHMHLLVAPSTGNLVDIIGSRKKFTGHFLKNSGLTGPFWQRGFYDHALRKDEDLVKAAEYLVMNPVRAGLAERWEEYQFSWHKWM